jgi:DNA-binding CsgD family transcriptional regulator
MTAREIEVLDLILRGRDQPGDCGAPRRLTRPSRTTSANVLAKLHLVDRTQAAIRGRETGLG